MAGDILGFATKSSKNKPAAVLSSNGTQKNIDQIKKNAGLLADVVGSGADDSYKQFVSSQPKKQQQKQVVEPAPQQPKQSTSLFSKVKNFTNDNLVKPAVQTGEKVGNTATAGVAGVVGLTTAGVQAAKGNTKGAKQTIDAANKEVGGLLDKGAGGKGGYITSKQAQSSGGGKKAFVNDFVKPTAQAATDVAPYVLPVGKTVKGASLLAKVGRGALDNAIVAGGTTTANEALNGQLTKDNGSQILKSAVTGAVIGGLAPALHGGAKAAVGDKAAAKELARNTAATSLLDKARKTPDDPKATAELPKPGEVITPTPQPELHPDTAKVLHDTMATVHQPKAALEADAAKQAETEAAGKQSEQAAKDAEKATADTKKIDQQLEVYDAKAKDAKDGKLSNVDQVKVKQLKEQKAELAQTTNAADAPTKPTAPPADAAPPAPAKPAETSSVKPDEQSSAKDTPTTQSEQKAKANTNPVKETTTATKPTTPKPETEFKSRVYERLKAEHPNELKDDVSYDSIHLKDQAEKATKLVAEDKQKAYRIATGQEVSSDLTATHANIVLAQKALDEGNEKLYESLTRNRSLAQTRRGQELVSEKASIGDNSTDRYVKELLASRMEQLGNKHTFGINLKKVSSKETAVGVIDKEVKKLDTQIRNKKLDTKTALALLDKMECL